MRVTVKADIEQRCFQLQIHIFQSLLQHAQHLFGTAEYKTAREIAEILDLVLPAGIGGGVIWAWKKFAKREKEVGSRTDLMIQHQHGGVTVIYNFYGDGTSLEMPTPVYQLATDPEVTELGKKVLKPLEQPGYETLTFHEGETDRPVIQVTKE